MGNKVVVIGAGLGGLECGWILARHGMEVHILEAAAVPGGCLQSFQRKGIPFDTGFHYVGGLNEGESLHPLFAYFGLLDLPWERLDPLAFEKIVFPDASYSLPNGFDAYEERLCSYFPEERTGIRKLVDAYRHVSAHGYDRLYPEKEDGTWAFVQQGAWDFIRGLTSQPRLQDVLCGSALKMELTERLPLFSFCEINASFIQSSWRLSGGGGRIVQHLIDSIRSMGGEVRCASPVTAIQERDGKVCGVETAAGERIAADWVIADIHPARLLALLPDCRQIHRSFRSRISRLTNSHGMFTAQILLEEGKIPYQQRNVFVYAEGADLWHLPTHRTDRVMISYYPSATGYATQLDLLSPMEGSPLRDFGGRPGQRPEAYEALKREKLAACIALASREIPGLEQAIQAVYTSTPLSYLYYTGSPDGSAYGIRKDFQSPLTTMLSPRTPLSGLYMTGQNLYLHGILGTSMTSVYSCAEILGSTQLRQEIFGEMPY